MYLTARERLYDDAVDDCTTSFVDAVVRDGQSCALEQA